MFIDSHAHIDGDAFDGDRKQMLARAREAGIDDIIVIGAAGTMATVRRAVALATTSPHLHATVGVHPHDAGKVEDHWWAELEELAASESVCGVGETGLDFYYDHSTPAEQERAFHRHIALARKVGKPLICHIRDAHPESRTILATVTDVPVVIHCFTGTADDAAAYVDMGFHISFSGIVTFPSAEPIREAVRVVPHDRILVETDCPYLAPVPLRGKRNAPAFLVHTAEVVAREAGLTTAELGQVTTANTRELFALTSS
jgi:TatD DNase family protein